MSAIERLASGLMILTQERDPNSAFIIGVMALGNDELAFFNKRLFDGNTDEPGEEVDSFAVDAVIPESMACAYVGLHPERLVEGFTALAKPAGCEWMVNSRIKSVSTHLGSVLVELEPALGKAQ